MVKDFKVFLKEQKQTRVFNSKESFSYCPVKGYIKKENTNVKKRQNIN